MQKEKWKEQKKNGYWVNSSAVTTAQNILNIGQIKTLVVYT